MSKEDVELENRDPNGLSEHLQVSWEDVIGEPGSIRSPECAWRLSHQCFRGSRNCCYILMSVIVAPICAVLLGLTFACFSFQHIWCWVPCLRLYKISGSMVRNYVLVFVQAIIIPFTNGCGHLFSAIKIKKQTIPEDYEKKEGFVMV